MNFGIRVAFDSGKCTGPDCNMDWRNYGYNVGCNNLGQWPFPMYLCCILRRKLCNVAALVRSSFCGNVDP